MGKSLKEKLTGAALLVTLFKLHTVHLFCAAFSRYCTVVASTAVDCVMCVTFLCVSALC